LTVEWLECIADIVRYGVAAGEFHVADADVAARRLLTMIDGLGRRSQAFWPVVFAAELGTGKRD
jgi:hypothetical protein